MTNKEMFTAIIERMDSMEAGLNGRIDKLDERIDKLDERINKLDERTDKLESRFDRLESRFDKLESDMDMEFKAVRAEMNVGYKTLKQDISVVNNKVDRLLYIEDSHTDMKMQIALLSDGYRALKEKIG